MVTDLGKTLLRGLVSGTTLSVHATPRVKTPRAVRDYSECVGAVSLLGSERRFNSESVIKDLFERARRGLRLVAVVKKATRRAADGFEGAENERWRVRRTGEQKVVGRKVGNCVFTCRSDRVIPFRVEIR